MNFFQVQTTDGLSWSSISFIVLIGSLFLSGYILWRRYLSRQRLIKRVAELEALSAAGRAIVVAELDVMAMCELIAEEAGQVIDNRTFQVGLFYSSWYEILYWRINGRKQEVPRSFSLEPERGLVGWIRDSKQPLLIRDFEKEMKTLPAQPRYISESPPRSALFLPLISGEQVIGIMAAQSPLPRRFDEDDLRRLTILANQAAAGIANAQLFEQERKRAMHLELVGNIARQVNAVQDLEEIFKQVVLLTTATFGFTPVSIFTIDPQTGSAVVQASSIPKLLRRGAFLPAGEGIVGAALIEGRTIVCNHTVDDARYSQQLGSFIAADVQSEISIPLIVNEEVFGVLDVQSKYADAFSPAEQMVLEALADEVASAIYMAEQLMQQREQAWMTMARLQVVESLSSVDNVEDITALITRLTPMLVGVQFCGVLLWDDEREQYEASAFYGADKTLMAQIGRLQLSIGQWPALDAVHVGREILTTRQIPDWLQATAAHKQIDFFTLFPMYTTKGTIGLFLVNRFRRTPSVYIGKHQVGMRRTELVENIVQQTAQEIESSQLQSARREEAWVNTALLEVAKAVNSLIDMDEILNTIVRLVPMLVGVEAALVLTWDRERQLFQIGSSYGVSDMGRGLIDTMDVSPAELPELAQLRQPSEPAVTYYMVQPLPWLKSVLATNTVYMFPLKARSRLVGIMLVGVVLAENGRALSSRRLQILDGIAQQAATAVINNRLYKEAAERDRLEQELNVAREIQSSFIPDGSPHIAGCRIASYWEAARQVSGDFYDFLTLRDGNWGIVIADVADKGVPAALFMALSRTIVRTVAFPRDDPSEVLMRANQIIDSDSQSDLFVTVFYAMWHPQTRTLTYANGGHNPPLLIRHGGEMTLLHGQGMALGILPDIQVSSYAVTLAPGDVVIFYTDGVTEAMNEDFDEFGMERLQLVALGAMTQTASGIVEAIVRGIRDHAGDSPQFDDISFIVMKVLADEA